MLVSILIAVGLLLSLRCILHAMIWFEYERPIEALWYGAGVCIGMGTIGLALLKVAPHHTSLYGGVAVLVGFVAFAVCGCGFLNLPFRHG